MSCVCVCVFVSDTIGVEFADHHDYSDGELENMAREARMLADAADPTLKRCIAVTSEKVTSPACRTNGMTLG